MTSPVFTRRAEAGGTRLGRAPAVAREPGRDEGQGLKYARNAAGGRSSLGREGGLQGGRVGCRDLSAGSGRPRTQQLAKRGDGLALRSAPGWLAKAPLHFRAKQINGSGPMEAPQGGAPEITRVQPPPNLTE